MTKISSVLNVSVDSVCKYESLQTIDHCGQNLATILTILSSFQMFII